MTKKVEVFKQTASNPKGFATENKYRNKRIDNELEEFEKQIEENQNSSIVEEEDKKKEVVQDNKQKDDDNHDWKKRYGDVRSYASRLENKVKELEQKFNEIEKNKNKPTYPKTEEEIKAWLNEFPEVGAIMQTIAGVESDKRKEELKEELNELKREKENLAFERAYNKLLKLQPDFEKIKKDKKFCEFDEDNNLVGGWLSEQPNWIKNAIFNPTFDDQGVKAASRVIDLYKNELGLQKSDTSSKKDNEDFRKAAATTVNTKNNSDYPSQEMEDGPRFLESQIMKMSSREFEKLEEKITEARRKGPPYFIYDVSNPQ